MIYVIHITVLSGDIRADYFEMQIKMRNTIS